MFLEESYWIKRELQKISDIKDVIDIGASTLEFRTVRQPYIEENIFKPLKDRGIKITYLDMKCQNGVDISLDISDKGFSFREEFDLVICTNILEHIERLDTSIINLSNLVKDNGYLIVTVPYVYPYHPDPIDNMLRFTIKDLKTLFKNFDVISAETINVESRTFFHRFRIGINAIVKILIDMKIAYLKINIINHLIKRLKVTCIIFKKKSNKI